MQGFGKVYSAICVPALAAVFFFGMSSSISQQIENKSNVQKPAVYEDACKTDKEKSRFVKEYVITRHEGSVYLHSPVDGKEFVFDVYQRFTDFSNTSPGVLACYDTDRSGRWPNTGCNMEITPCQKKALKELAESK